MAEWPIAESPPAVGGCSSSGFGDRWWIPGDEYDDSMRVDWARAV